MKKVLLYHGGDELSGIFQDQVGEWQPLFGEGKRVRIVRSGLQDGFQILPKADCMEANLQGKLPGTSSLQAIEALFSADHVPGLRVGGGYEVGLVHDGFSPSAEVLELREWVRDQHWVGRLQHTPHSLVRWQLDNHWGGNTPGAMLVRMGDTATKVFQEGKQEVSVLGGWKEVALDLMNFLFKRKLGGRKDAKYEKGVWPEVCNQFPRWRHRSRGIEMTIFKDLMGAMNAHYAELTVSFSKAEVSELFRTFIDRLKNSLRPLLVEQRVLVSQNFRLASELARQFGPRFTVLDQDLVGLLRQMAVVPSVWKAESEAIVVGSEVQAPVQTGNSEGNKKRTQTPAEASMEQEENHIPVEIKKVNEKGQKEDAQTKREASEQQKLRSKRTANKVSVPPERKPSHTIPGVFFNLEVYDDFAIMTSRNILSSKEEKEYRKVYAWFAQKGNDFLPKTIPMNNSPIKLKLVGRMESFGRKMKSDPFKLWDWWYFCIQAIHEVEIDSKKRKFYLGHFHPNAFLVRDRGELSEVLIWDLGLLPYLYAPPKYSNSRPRLKNATAVDLKKIQGNHYADFWSPKIKTSYDPESWDYWDDYYSMGKIVSEVLGKTGIDNLTQASLKPFKELSEIHSKALSADIGPVFPKKREKGRLKDRITELTYDIEFNSSSQNGKSKA